VSNERDPDLEQAWRAHSRETPPAALDAAILAAAHRAVDSKPRAATGAPRWWMPVMAAAAIGAVAIGVVQLAPPPEPALDTGSSSVVASVEPKRVEPPAVATPPADVPKPAVAEAPAKKQKEFVERPAAAAGGVVGTRVAPVPSPNVQQAPVPPAPAAREVPRENKVAADRAPEPFPGKAESSEARRGAEVAGFAADAPAPTAKRDLEDARKDAGNERQLAAAAPPPAPAAAPVPSAPPPAAPVPSAPPPAAPVPSAPTGAASVPSTPAAAPAPPAPARTEATASRMIESDRARGQVSGMLQKNAAVASASEKARDPDAWITRIRKLRDEGQTAEALRELREFRSNVPDAEKRLPVDLRELK